jgi:SAM-dependent methyltransferase
MSETIQPQNALHPSPEEALEVWAAMVLANREQAERVREKPERIDFYAPTAAVFKVDPRRSGESVLDFLRTLAGSDETWLDIGAGGGRYALPLALKVKEVIAVEPSASMQAILLQGMNDYNIRNIRMIDGRWPLENPPAADVALIAHVGYDIENIGPFLEAMEASARRLCIAIFTDRAPSAAAAPFWPGVHGEKRRPLPSLREFLVLQIARGRLCEVLLVAQSSPGYPDRELLLTYLRQQLFIEPEGAKARLLQQLVEEQVKAQDDRWSLPSSPGTLGIVTWRSLPQSGY